MGWAGAALPLSLMILWTWSALQLTKLADTFIADHSIRDATPYHQVLHRLIYGQGVWLVIASTLMVYAVQCIYWLGSMHIRIHFSNIPHLLTATLRDVVDLHYPVLMMMIWLTCLMVIVPRRPLPIWLTMAAVVLNFVIISPGSYVRYYDFTELLKYTQISADSGLIRWGWIAGIVVMCAMLLLFRSKFAIAGWCCFTLVIAALITEPVFPQLVFMNIDSAYVPWVLVITKGLNSVSSCPPEVIGNLADWVWQPRKHWMMELHNLLAYVLWFMASFALIHYLVLRPKRVESKKAQSM